MVSMSQKVHQAEDVGQMTMFDMFGAAAAEAPGSAAAGIRLPEVEPLSRKELLSWEKELVGFYVSEHPLAQVALSLKDTVTCFCGEITQEHGGQNVVVSGLVQWVRPHITKRGDPMAFVHLEDLQGSIEVVVFPRVYAATRDLWEEDKILIVRGRVDAERGDPKILCDSAQDYLLTARPVDEGAAAAPPVSVPRAAPPQASAPQPPPQAAEASVPTVVREAPGAYKTNGGRRGSGGRGNGHNGNGNGARHKSAPPVQAVAPATAREAGPAPRHVDLIVRRTGNQGVDVALVQEVCGLLDEAKGNDTFSIMVVNDTGRVRVDFPKRTTGWSPVLARSLGELLGEDGVRLA